MPTTLAHEQAWHSRNRSSQHSPWESVLAGGLPLHNRVLSALGFSSLFPPLILSEPFWPASVVQMCQQEHWCDVGSSMHKAAF